MSMSQTIFTIGYAGYKTLDILINTLKERGIDLLIDVRSIPFSKYYVAFDINNLSQELRRNQIDYWNPKDEFGARRPINDMRNGRVDFEIVKKSPPFLLGVDKVKAAMGEGRTPVLFCAEANPIECHRCILIGKYFADAGYDVLHLMYRRQAKTQADIDDELLNKYFPKVQQISLFDTMAEDVSREDQLRQAYKLANDEVGWSPTQKNI